MAKGLGAGYQPIGAVVANDRVYQAIASGSGFFQHGHTFMAHPVACAAAVATIQTIGDQKLLQAVNQQGAMLKENSSQHFQTSRILGIFVVKGCFLALNLWQTK